MTDTPRAPDAHADFSALALAAMDDVYRFARSLTRDEADAEDVVQEAYLRAFRSWHTFQPGTDVRRWLFTIARNVFLRSKEKARREVTLDEDGAEAVDAAAAVESWVMRGLNPILDRADLGPAIQAALDELPATYRDAVVLVDLEDQAYEDAAAVLGIPIGTVRSRLFRGRKLLQEKLATFAEDAGFAATAGKGESGGKDDE
ncbi:MAG TPA: sigma-70 family RNA polymerase sigma factor [Gemmatimonadaceae bacterium]|nr:sigma-70 family RNA polymerase sigma factor [Gemmatimonadaceae bacterium]